MIVVAYGRPITQGSKVRNRWGGVRDDNDATLRPWRDNVRSAALDALGPGMEFGTAPVRVKITFTFARPAGHYGTGRNTAVLRPGAPAFPATRSSGDLDKLIRSCLDSLTDAGVWRDDSQVVVIDAAKVYAGDPAALVRPGVSIEIMPTLELLR